MSRFFQSESAYPLFVESFDGLILDPFAPICYFTGNRRTVTTRSVHRPVDHHQEKARPNGDHEPKRQHRQRRNRPLLGHGRLWWDRTGEFKALHDINPVRLAYVRDRTELAGSRVVDVGCGGGLLSEGLAASGARVTGIDMAGASLAVARDHMQTSGLDIDYQQTTAEAHADENAEHYDAAVCMELLEHVPRPASIIAACARLVRPGGSAVFLPRSTAPGFPGCW
jgi:SAM-dependent methyltransferase